MKRLLVTPLLLLLPVLTAFGQFGQFGISTSIFGDVVLISHLSEGSVFTFKQNADGEWEQTGEIFASDEENAGIFGYSLAIHGGHLLVGSPSPEPGEGVIYIFEYDVESDDFDEVGIIEGVGNDQLGGSLVVVGNALATAGFRGGHVTLFEYDGTSWERSGSVSVGEMGAEDEASPVLSVTMDSERLYIGAAGADAVHVVRRSDLGHETVLTPSDSTIQALGFPLATVGEGAL